MINTRKFSKRLEKILEYHELTASAFADKIGVGRSSISHILSGRNKPSLDFILKIHHTFPTLNLYWLIEGKEPFLMDQNAASPTPDPTKPATSSQEKTLEQPNQAPTQSPVAHSKDIDKVIIFYKDGSFDSFQN